MIAEHYLAKLKDRIRGIKVAESLTGMRAALDTGLSGTDSFDVVLLDLTLPDSPMEQTLQGLPQLTGQYSPKFVVMSSLGNEEVARRALEGGAAAFLAKQDIKADNLRRILDELHPVQGDAVLGDAAEPNQASPKEHSAPLAVAPDHAAPVDGPDLEELDGKDLASKIAHDALSWVANVAFRASHIASDPAAQASKALMDDVASLRTSADALQSFISGARSLVNGELAIHEGTGPSPSALETIELGPWLQHFAARWKKTTRNKRLAISTEAVSRVQVRGSSAPRRLAQCLSALLENADAHGQDQSGEVSVSIREEPIAGANASLTIIDDGGPWQVADPSLLGTPLGTGTPNAPSAGLGLFNARRGVESMGGALTFFERSDAPGAFGIRLVLPLA